MFCFPDQWRAEQKNDVFNFHSNGFPWNTELSYSVIQAYKNDRVIYYSAQKEKCTKIMSIHFYWTPCKIKWTVKWVNVSKSVPTWATAFTKICIWNYPNHMVKVHIFSLGQIPRKFSINTDKEMQINLTIILWNQNVTWTKVMETKYTSEIQIGTR